MFHIVFDEKLLSGSHGKTTTTSLKFNFSKTKLDPTIIMVG